MSNRCCGALGEAYCDAIAAPHAAPVQCVGQAIGPIPQFVERELLDATVLVLVYECQSATAICPLVAAIRADVEIGRNAPRSPESRLVHRCPRAGRKNLSPQSILDARL